MSDAQQQERRIAACLNACQSVSTEDLERYYMTGAGIDEAMEEAGLQDHLKVVHQRDQLLAALKAITDPNQVASHGDPSVLRNYARAAIAAAEAAQPVVQHPDDAAVDRFAAAMKYKLAISREKGRSGWQKCDPADISHMLREHVEKGDPRDVANFCMFLWHHGVGIAQQTASAQPVAVPDGKQNIGTNPVKDGYFLCKCDECGWIGSSEETESGADGETYYCPSCRYESPDELISAAQTFNAMLSAAQIGGAA